MLHFDGREEDYGRWRAQGAENWNFTGLRTKLHTTSIPYEYSILSKALVDGAVQLNVHKHQLEYQLAKYNVKNGLRHTTFHSYLRPSYERPNLKILLNTRCHRIQINAQKVADGVFISEDNFSGAERVIRAAKEIILSAGSFHTPQILKLSGVGPSNELSRFKIPVTSNSPMVGRNLFDHISLPLYVTVNETASITQSKVLSSKELLNFMLHGQGILANFGVIGYLSDRQMDHSVGIFGVGSIDERMLRKITNTEKGVRRSINLLKFSRKPKIRILNS